MPKKERKEYLVVWQIDITARDHKEAAEIALDMQRDPGSLATVFDVYEQGDTGAFQGRRIDLLDPDEKPVKIRRI
ncbi:MAG: hypothetical protein WC279_14480 [Sulfurimonas sp.]|uniref:hypothetical protein n=1 Tax=Sulfurimonas sp. TaxID=2022749 RepID=UPI00356AA7D5